MIHRYGDDSVDGELAIPVERGTGVEDLLWQVSEAFKPGSMTGEYWVSIGQRYTIKEDEEVYRRFKGMNELAMHFTRATNARIQAAFGAARMSMTRGAEKKFRRKADSVFVRIHWNPKNAKPRR